MNDTQPPISVDWSNPDPGIERLVRALAWARRTSPYWWLTSPQRFGGRFATPGFAYAYTLVWAGVLALALASSTYWVDTSPVVAAAVVLVVILRLWDILRWWAGFLFDRRHFAVLSRERNVLFIAFNLVEVTFIGSVLLRAADPGPTSLDRWFDAFFLVTQLGLPDGQADSWEKTAYVVTEASALVLLLGGLAALISLVGEKLREQPWGGPHGGSGPLAVPRDVKPPITKD